jgi:hypothetical protein
MWPINAWVIGKPEVIVQIGPCGDYFSFVRHPPQIAVKNSSNFPLAQ